MLSGGLDGKQSACNEGDVGMIPRLGRSSGGRNGDPFQYPYLENSRNREAQWAIVYRFAKSQTRLNNTPANTRTHTHTHTHTQSQ